MKKFTLILIATLIFGLVATSAMNADNPGRSPINSTDFVNSTQHPGNEYLPTLIEGFVRVIPFNTSVYIIHESEIEAIESEAIAADNEPWNTGCDQIIPTTNQDYYRILSEDDNILLTHKNEMASLCGTGDVDNPSQNYSPYGLTFCNAIEAYIPTNSEHYYRILLRDGSLYLVQTGELAFFCNITI